METSSQHKARWVQPPRETSVAVFWAHRRGYAAGLNANFEAGVAKFNQIPRLYGLRGG